MLAIYPANAYAKPYTPEDPTITYASLVQVLANQEKFHGTLVQFIAYARNEGDGVAFYLTYEDALNENSKDGVWSDKWRFDETAAKRPVRCLIAGIYDSAHNGPGGLWSGEMQKIEKVVILGK